jgi:hypothetical protein
VAVLKAHDAGTELPVVRSTCIILRDSGSKAAEQQLVTERWPAVGQCGTAHSLLLLLPLPVASMHV